MSSTIVGLDGCPIDHFSNQASRKRCLIAGCRAAATELRATQIHNYVLCQSHAVAWDENRVAGSSITGWLVLK